MGPYLFILPLLAVSVSLLVSFEIRKKRAGIYITKPLSTILVIVTCLFSLCVTGADRSFSLAIALGLFLSFGGDVALMFQEKATAFRIGLILFLVAHVVYGVAFIAFSGAAPELPYISALFFGLGTAVYIYLLGGLGTMKAPVALYILIISFMASAAVSTLYVARVGVLFSVLVAGGSLLFYISDLILAINRFRIPMRYNRLSLIPYYAGQFLIAVSTYWATSVR